MLGRRDFLSALAVGAMMPRLAHASTGGATVPLWPDSPPGGGGPAGPTETNPPGTFFNVSVPTVDIFRPERPNGSAVLIAAGGGYKTISNGWEGKGAADWFNARGVTAFILTYRLPGEGWKAGALAPLQDAQRAMRLIRSNAGRWNLDPQRIGSIGFSAGGHLIGMTATRSSFRAYAPIDTIDTISSRPDWAVLAYPVITMQLPYGKSMSRRILIGPEADAALVKAWSVETYVGPDCPPLFLMDALDDPVINPQNGVIMAEACKKAGVKAELMRLSAGGHGFGMGKRGSPTADWPLKLESWLKLQGVVS
ncbi:pectin acetylesterase [Rhizobium rhizosphaerae]|uniref:Alpha/beta hydrolase n=1 Tax=Xaviernesmea rhizosphaerae TaxID=1672749 RepID=A0A1Q9AG46_9HYPH|nr:alpha/beta hydrolase [Xaviernesmea rhizosphaerae]OLP53894.1 pectin acetylesterase [Xaviernesmea rhizosphaerae]OQP88098.1 alpha/beta hydrolase [Xaviernesmea rhizosphaerae]